MNAWEVAEQVWRFGFIPLAIALLAIVARHAWKVSNVVVREPPVLGRRPNKGSPDALKATIKRLQRLENRYTLLVALNWLQVGLFGIVLPVLLFFNVCLYATALVEASPFVLSGDGSWRRVTPSEQQVVWYVWDQILDPLTLGLADTAQWPMSSVVTHDTNNIVAVAVVFLFRGIVNFFGVSWVISAFFGAAQAKLGRTKIQERINEHDQELAAATQEKANATAPTEKPELSLAA